VDEDLANRIKALEQQVKLLSTDHVNKGRVLPCIEEAWTLPIPAELTQRQSAFKYITFEACFDLTGNAD